MSSPVPTITEAVVAEIARHAESVDRDARFPKEGLEALREAGLLGLGVPAEFGGPGGGPVEIAMAIRAIGAACGSTSMVYAMHAVATQTLFSDPGADGGPKATALRAIGGGRAPLDAGVLGEGFA